MEALAHLAGGEDLLKKALVLETIFFSRGHCPYTALSIRSSGGLSPALRRCGDHKNVTMTTPLEAAE
jgi:hypothetical protein